MLLWELFLSKPRQRIYLLCCFQNLPVHFWHVCLLSRFPEGESATLSLSFTPVPVPLDSTRPTPQFIDEAFKNMILS